MSNRTFNAALAGAFAAAVALAAVPGNAASDDAGKEKCFGVAKAGHNDCASTGNNGCPALRRGTSRKPPGCWCPKEPALLPR